MLAYFRAMVLVMCSCLGLDGIIGGGCRVVCSLCHSVDFTKTGQTTNKMAMLGSSGSNYEVISEDDHA